MNRKGLCDHYDNARKLKQTALDWILCSHNESSRKLDNRVDQLNVLNDETGKYN